MKILMLLSLLLLANKPLVYSQSTGVAFQKNTWKQALSQANKDRKLIFVDVYTSWCGPCKLLDREVFSNSKVGSVFNKQFVNLKIDAEKGEGIALAKAYHVSAYPTLLFVTPKGQLVHEVIGVIAVSKLLAESELALSKRNGSSKLSFQGRQPLKSLREWDRSYSQHRTDTSFLYHYIQARHENNVLDNSQLLDHYLQLLAPAQRFSTKNLILISTCLETFDSQAGQVLIDHIREANQLEGKGYSMGRTGGMAEATFAKAVAKRDTHVLTIYNRISPMLAKLYSPYTIQDTQDSLSLLQTNRLRYLKATHDTTAYLNAVATYVTTYLVRQSAQQLQQKDAYTERWFMSPYLTGKEDSTKVPGFAAIKQSLIQDRTRSAADRLVGYSTDFVLMKANAAQLRQALGWTKRAQQLVNKADYVVAEASILRDLGQPLAARQRLIEAIQRTKGQRESSTPLEKALLTYPK